jgi:RHS repeat-associated protein
VTASPGVEGVEGWPLETQYGYDALDNLTHAWDDRGVDVERMVWSTGEVESETLTVGGSSFVTSAGYDDTFLPESLGYPDGTSVTFGRSDPAGRLSSLSVGGVEVWSQLYAGLRRGEGATGALATSRSYDTEGRPAVVSAALQDSERFRLERGYNDASRFKTQTVRAGVSATTSLGHDPAQRAQTWRMDRAHVDGVDGLLGWAGPANGRVINQFAGSLDRLASKAEFIDGEGLLTSFRDPGLGHQLPGAGPWSYAYDGFGNRFEAASNAETRRFHHDWSNRLIEVLSTPAPDEPVSSLVSFVYDPLGRRIATTEGDLTTYRVPWGDQIIAEYLEASSGEAQLRKRSYWGDGIDDLLAYDWDADANGTLESRLHPLTDAQGTVQAIATPDGLVVESYIYRPDGTFMIFGDDTTAPQLVLARLRPADEASGRSSQTLEMVFTEPAQQAGGTAEVQGGGGEVLSQAAAPTSDARRWTMVIAPALVAGESYTFLLSGFEDRAGNLMEGAIAVAFEAPAEDQPLAVVSLAEPEILAVIDGPDGLALIAGAPVDPTTVEASSLTVTRSGNEVAGTLALVDAATDPAWDGRVLLWTPDDSAAYLGARYDVALDLALLDVAGRPVDGPSTLDYDHIGQGDIVWSKPAEAPLLGGSQVGNDRFLHGRPYIRTLGLYDHRARFYEPGTQLFLEPDPLGPVDSPNLYQAFGFDAGNVTDPWGMMDVTFGREKVEGRKTATSIYLRPLGGFERWFLEGPGSFAGIGRFHQAIRSGYSSSHPRFGQPMSDAEGFSNIPIPGGLGAAAGKYAVGRVSVKVTEGAARLIGRRAAEKLVEQAASKAVSVSVKHMTRAIVQTAMRTSSSSREQFSQLSGCTRDELGIYMLWAENMDSVELYLVGDGEDRELWGTVRHPGQESLGLRATERFISEMSSKIDANEKTLSSLEQALPWVDYFFDSYDLEAIAFGSPQISGYAETRYHELREYISDNAYTFAHVSKGIGYLSGEPLHRLDFLLQVWEPDAYYSAMGEKPLE